MLTLKIPHKEIGLIQKISKLSKSSDTVYLVLNYIAKIDVINFSLRGAMISMDLSLDCTDFSVADAKDVHIMTSAGQFIAALDTFSEYNKVTLKLDKASLEVSHGKRCMKLPVFEAIADNPSVHLPIKKLEISSLVAITRSIAPITSINAMSIISEQYVMTMDSNLRETICLIDLGKDKFPKEVASGTKKIPLSIGVNSKNLEQVTKATSAANVYFANNSVAIDCVVAKDRVNSLNFSLVCGKNALVLTLRLLEDSFYSKETAVLSKCSTFTTTNKFSIDCLVFANSAASARITDDDTKLILSNKKDLKALEISTLSGLYQDEIPIESDCKFAITVRNVHLETILKHIAMGKVEVHLQGNLPIVTFKEGNNTYYVSCFNDAKQGMPFEVEAIKNVKPTVVHKNTDNKAGAVSVGTGSTENTKSV